MSWDLLRASQQSRIAGGSLLHNATELFEGRRRYLRWEMHWSSHAENSEHDGVWLWGVEELGWPGCTLGSSMLPVLGASSLLTYKPTGKVARGLKLPLHVGPAAVHPGSVVRAAAHPATPPAFGPSLLAAGKSLFPWVAGCRQQGALGGWAAGERCLSLCGESFTAVFVAGLNACFRKIKITS